MCSIEGGFLLDENGLPFVVIYCITENNLGQKLKVNNNKQLFQITEYLTNGLYNREDINSEAVISSLIPFIYSEQRKKMNEQIKELKN